MDQIYPQGEQSCSDYIDNWVDKTIQSEIRRGKKLQELKHKPTTRNNKYHVVSIGDTKFYREKKHSKGRSQSPTKHTRKVLNHSPNGINSPTRKTNKDSLRCPMRTAELAVPSKRHCIETWRNNFHILPGIMVDRLKQHVYDMTPVVQIPDAIECFLRSKNSKRRKRETDTYKSKKRTRKIKDKSNGTTFEDDPKITPRKLQQRQNLCILFGHKIAKKLHRPAIITLCPELEKISDVITVEIDHLLRNGRNNASRNIKYKRIEAEFIAKITVWISGILDDTADKIIEDQLIDLDEEIGPVLDFLDDLIDKVVEICEPEPKYEISSSETYNVESSTEYVDDEDGDFDHEQKESLASLDLDIFIKNELDTIIDSFDKGHLDANEDINDQNEIANETDKVVEGGHRESLKRVSDSRARHILQGLENYTIDDTMALEAIELQDVNENFGPTKTETENEESNADQGTEVNETITLESNEVDDDDLSKKVKFSEKSLVTNYDTANNEKTDSQKSDFMNPDIVFAEPNDHLLSNADEAWPEDIVSPVVRPSVSVNKSISSLGFVVEAEERTSIMLAEDTVTILRIKTTEPHSIYVTKTVEITDAIKDTTINAEINSNEVINGNNEAVSHQVDAIIGANTNGETKENIAEESTDQDSKDTQNITSKDKSNIVTEGGTPEKTTEPNVKYVPKDAQKIESDLAQKYAEGIIHRASTDSTFISDVSTEPITYEKTLEKITENEAAQVTSQSQNILEEKAAQAEYLEKEKYDTSVHDQAIQASKLEKNKPETSEKTTNTSFSLMQREDKSTSAVSQSLADIAKRLSSGKPEFSSLRIKPKMDYKVNKDSAPAWVTQNFGEPSPKEDSDKHIRLWCKDLQTGFENLELWNEWLENTLGNIEIMERDKARMEVYQSRDESIREWIHLKKNVDADVVTWIKHSHSTQEKIKCFRKVYKKFQEPSTNVRNCNCNKK